MPPVRVSHIQPVPPVLETVLETVPPVREPDTIPPPTPTPPPTPRLPWVNPAHCHPTCTFDPAPQLIRVNDQATTDPKGRHRILPAIQPDLQELLLAAHRAGHAIRIESAYRSYEDQARLFASMKEAGRAARPGHSEHQLGSVVDLRLPTSAAIEWLAAHAADHAFALSYPAQKQRLTGYRPEPWHLRHVGRELALELRSTNTILEQLFRARPPLAATGNCADCPLPASRADCADTTAAGFCDGNVLTWCYDGSLARVDCAVSGQRCGRSKTSEEFDCLPNGPVEVASKSP